MLFVLVVYGLDFTEYIYLIQMQWGSNTKKNARTRFIALLKKKSSTYAWRRETFCMKRCLPLVTLLVTGPRCPF